MTVPSGSPLAGLTTRVMVWDSPGVRVPSGQVTVRPLAGQAGSSCSIVVRFPLVGSWTVTLTASDGPLLVTTMVYVMVPSGWTVAGAVLVISTSTRVCATLISWYDLFSPSASVTVA